MPRSKDQTGELRHKKRTCHDSANVNAQRRQATFGNKKPGVMPGFNAALPLNVEAVSA